MPPFPRCYSGGPAPQPPQLREPHRVALLAALCRRFLPIGYFWRVINFDLSLSLMISLRTTICQFEHHLPHCKILLNLAPSSLPFRSSLSVYQAPLDSRHRSRHPRSDSSLFGIENMNCVNLSTTCSIFNQASRSNLLHPLKVQPFLRYLPDPRNPFLIPLPNSGSLSPQSSPRKKRPPPRIRKADPVQFQGVHAREGEFCERGARLLGLAPTFTAQSSLALPWISSCSVTVILGGGACRGGGEAAASADLPGRGAVVDGEGGADGGSKGEGFGREREGRSSNLKTRSIKDMGN